MKQRLLSLDVLRGLTIAGMIVVNSPGTWSHICPMLLHSPWNGFTFADQIFPLFVFMMGFSMYISLRKYGFALHRELTKKILRRTFTIFIIGTFIYATATFLDALRTAYNDATIAESPWLVAFQSLAHVRTLGVLQRLALCYGIGSLLVCTIKHQRLPWLIAAILVMYYLLLILENGFEYGEGSILARTDQLLLGIQHMYNDNGIDPEGVLSTFPAIAQVLIGFCMSKMCMETESMNDKLLRLFLYGSIGVIAGFLLQDACPLNKKVWSPTFVLLTCGFASLALAILMWLIDVKKKNRRAWIFSVLGVNPLFCYVLSELLYVFIDYLPLRGKVCHEVLYAGLAGLLGDNAFASFLFAFAFLFLVWCVGAWLWKKKIYIKI